MGKYIQLGQNYFPSGFTSLAWMLSHNELMVIPTNGGWTEVAVDTGSGSQSVLYTRVSTGVNINSSDLYRTPLGGLHLNDAATQRLDWSKELWVIFDLTAENSVAQAYRRFTIKEVNTIGALAEQGIGIEIADLGLYLETYGASRNTQNTSVTLIAGKWKRYCIHHQPAVPKVELMILDATYTPAAIVATETTSAKIPQSAPAGDIYAMISVQNYGTATAAILNITNLWILQRVGG